MESKDILALIGITAAVVIGAIMIDQSLPPDSQGISQFVSVGLKGVGWLLIILAAFIIFVLSAIGTAEKKWEFDRLYKVYKNLIRNKYLNALDKTAYHLNFTSAWHKRRIWPDRFPELLRENIVYLFSLNNYLKRFYIWKVKEGQVNDAEHIAKDVWTWISPLHRYYDNYNQLFEDIHKCRHGGRIELLDENGNVIGQADVGLFPAIRKFCDAANKASDLMADILREYSAAPLATDAHGNFTGSGRVPLPKAKVDEFTNKINDVRTGLTSANATLETSIEELKRREKVLGNLQLVKAQIILILDQCNPSGEQEHQYRFVPPGTQLVDQFGHTYTANHDLEVDMYGNVLNDEDEHDPNNKKDANSNKDGFYDPIDIRRPLKRVAPHEILAGKIKLLSPPYEIFESIKNDWQGGFRTMRFGKFKRFSKSFKDYVDAMQTMGKEQFYREENIIFTPGPKEEGTAAFDRRAKVDTGLMKYAGRRSIHQDFESVIHNPLEDRFPGVSSIGMGEYLINLVEKDTENMKLMNEYLSSFIQDVGKDVQTAKETPSTFKPLRAKEEEHK